jgi:hypothetical protein
VPVAASFVATIARRASLGALLLAVLAGAAGTLAPPARAQPAGAFEPGAVYKEYVRLMTGDGREWRVTDPDATHPGAQAFLPNPVLRLRIDDLEHAIAAEAVIDRWGGHAGTVGHRLRVNGRAWLDIPLLDTTPPGAPPEAYLFQDNPVVPIPLDHLNEGTNTIQGTSGGQTYADFGWGQWGWTAILVRVYYDPGKKEGAPSGTLPAPRSGATLGEDPRIQVAPASDSVERADVIAHYRGVDEDGDGHFHDWHRGYFAARGTTDSLEIAGHCGTAVGPPWTVRWDTEHVPTQDGIDVVARLQGANGLWTVTDVVRDLRLARAEEHVRMIPTHEMPKNATSRQGETKTAVMRIPPAVPVGSVTDAALFWRTWNGQDYQWRFGPYASTFRGADHNFRQQFYDLPRQAITPGRVPIRITAETEHHGVEALWPGPVLILRTTKPGSR